MLRKKRIIIDENDKIDMDSENNNILKLKRKIGSNNSSESKTNNTKNNFFYENNDYMQINIDWIKNNLLNNLIESLKNYEFLKIYSQDNYGNDVNDNIFVENILKAFFKENDLKIFNSNIDNIINELNLLYKEKEKFDELKKEYKKLKNQNQKYLTSYIEKQKVIDIILNNYNGEIKKLLAEEANQLDSGKFIIKFCIAFNNLLKIIEENKNKEEIEKIEIIYESSSHLLREISNLYVTNRRRILSLVADSINKEFTHYKFISGEDYTLIEPKIHNIIEKRGEKIKEALSFAVVKKDTMQIIKFSNVITY